MGVWGAGIFDDDTAEDVLSLFEEALEEGQSVATATSEVIQSLSGNDEYEEAVMYLALASLQLERDALQTKIRDLALNSIATGQALEPWEEDATPGDLAERNKVLEEFKAKLEAATTNDAKSKLKPKKPRAKRPKVREGDVIAVDLGENMVGAGIVLHLTKRHFKNSIMVGFYNRPYRTSEEIVEAVNRMDLGGDFIQGTPNYVPIYALENENWSVVGHSDKLLESTPIPTMVMVADIYYKDEFIRKLETDEYGAKKYAFISLMGDGAVEKRLRRNFSITNTDQARENQ